MLVLLPDAHNEPPFLGTGEDRLGRSTLYPLKLVLTIIGLVLDNIVKGEMVCVTSGSLKSQCVFLFFISPGLIQLI